MSHLSYAHRQGRPYQPVPTIISENLQKFVVVQIACASRDNLVGSDFDKTPIPSHKLTAAIVIICVQALTSTGKVFAWGSNAGAMLTDQPDVQREMEDGEPFQAIPRIVSGALADEVARTNWTFFLKFMPAISTHADMMSTQEVVQVACGPDHSLVLTVR